MAYACWFKDCRSERHGYLVLLLSIVQVDMWVCKHYICFFIRYHNPYTYFTFTPLTCQICQLICDFTLPKAMSMFCFVNHSLSVGALRHFEIVWPFPYSSVYFKYNTMNPRSIENWFKNKIVFLFISTILHRASSKA